MARAYELLYVIDPRLDEEATKALNDRIQNLVSANGTVGETEDWGKKRLAYEIDDQREGTYVLVNFTAEAEAPREIERVLRIADGVLRYLIVNKKA